MSRREFTLLVDPGTPGRRIGALQPAQLVAFKAGERGAVRERDTASTSRTADYGHRAAKSPEAVQHVVQPVRSEPRKQRARGERPPGDRVPRQRTGRPPARTTGCVRARSQSTHRMRRPSRAARPTVPLRSGHGARTRPARRRRGRALPPICRELPRLRAQPRVPDGELRRRVLAGADRRAPPRPRPARAQSGQACPRNEPSGRHRSPLRDAEHLSDHNRPAHRARDLGMPPDESCPDPVECATHSREERLHVSAGRSFRQQHTREEPAWSHAGDRDVVCIDGDGIRADLVPGEGDWVRRRHQCSRLHLDGARILADAWSYDDLRRESRLDEPGQELRRELSRGQRDRLRSRHHGLFLLQVAVEARVLCDWAGSVQESTRRSMAQLGQLFPGACCRNIHQCALNGLSSNALRTGIGINRRDVASSGCATKGTGGSDWGHHSDEV